MTPATRQASSFILEHAPEPWQALLALVAAAFLAWWGWRRYGPHAAGGAGALARLCRAAGLVALVALIAGPAWRTTTTSHLPGRVLVAIDRSASMARSDWAPGPGAARLPRIAAATALATALAKVEGERGLAVEYHAIGALSGPLDAAALRSGPPPATGASSPLADELERLVAEYRPDHLVVVSDGRVTSGSGLAGLPAAWRGRELGISALATGSDAVEPELAIDEIAVNHEVALDEREPVTVRFSHRALGPGPVTVTLHVEGQEPTRVEVQPEGGGEAATMHAATARLEASLHQEGPAKLRVVVEQGKLRREQEVAVTVRVRKLKVLMLAHRPLYEMRYLREALKRDKTITLHAYLAEGKWRRWGAGRNEAELGPDHLPLSPSELRDYDVVLISDLGPDAFRESELDALEVAVHHGGSGLVWMPGETGALAGFARVKLGALLPVELPDAAAISRGFLGGEPLHLSRTPVAASLGLLDPGEVEWADLPVLYGSCPVGGLKPGADVLVQDQRKPAQPVVVTSPWFSGRTLFVAVDDTWRWRRNVGDRYLHRFHSQLLRYVASGRRIGNQEWRLFANPRRAASGELLTLSLMPAGPAVENAPESVTVRLTNAGGEGAEQLLRLDREGHGYTARLPAPAPGTWNLAIAAGPDPRSVDTDQLLVLPPADELRDPRLDLAALESLTRGAGGRVFTSPEALVAALPDLRRSESISVVTGWWDTTWALVLIVGLFAVDWAIRRLNRLP